VGIPAPGRPGRRLLITAETGRLPEIDEPRAWNEYRRRHPDRRYAISKRRLSKAELKRHGLQDHAPEDVPNDPVRQLDRLSRGIPLPRAR
jgi:hypothetical protein